MIEADVSLNDDTDTAKGVKQATDGLAKKTEALKLDQGQTPATTSPPKIKSKGLDVAKLWSEGKAGRKPSAGFVVIGHVDHGKSTLMGRLLLDTGAVAQRDIDKYIAQSPLPTFTRADMDISGTKSKQRK